MPTGDQAVSMTRAEDIQLVRSALESLVDWMAKDWSPVGARVPSLSPEVAIPPEDCAACCGLHYASVWLESRDYLELLREAEDGRVVLDMESLRGGMYGDFLFHCLQSSLVLCHLRDYGGMDIRCWWDSPVHVPPAAQAQVPNGSPPLKLTQRCKDEWSRCFIRLLYELRPHLAGIAEEIGALSGLPHDDILAAYYAFARAHVSVAQATAVLLKWEPILNYHQQLSLLQDESKEEPVPPDCHSERAKRSEESRPHENSG